MTLVRRLIERPRTFAFRGWIFQIHLWTGLLLAIYAVVIGVTGSALVFTANIEDWRARDMLRVERAGTRVSADRVVESVSAAYPGRSIIALFPPSEPRGTFQAWLALTAKQGQPEVFIDPYDARVIGDRLRDDGFLGWLTQLHINLLGGRTGLVVNGTAALLLLAMSVTGLIVWWPGLGLWKRAMSVRWGGSWKVLTYDLHSAVGFFSLLFLLVLSATGAYFAWPRTGQHMISWFSPVRNTKNPPRVAVRAAGVRQMPLQQLLDVAQRTVPEAWPEVAALANQPGQSLRVYMLTGDKVSYQTTSTVDLDPYTGAVLQVQRARGRSAGDAVAAWIRVVHWGGFGGTPIKIVWMLFGLTPAISAISGVLMWWNRTGAKWLRRKAPFALSSRAEADPSYQEAVR